MTVPLIVQSGRIVNEGVRRYLEDALAVNSRRAYLSDLDHYFSWGGQLPSPPEDIANYLTDFADVLAIATLQRRLVSIGKAHGMNGYADPTKTELVKLTMRGIRRVHGKPQTQVAPVLKDDLTVMLSHCQDTTKGKRDAALLMLGFCAALRRSELVSVKVDHLESTSAGMILTLPRGKTDQVGHGRKIGIPKGRGRVCPVTIIEGWASCVGTSSYLFRAVTKGGMISDEPLSDKAVANVIKAYALKAGLDPSRYGGHSLRAGLATSAAQHGISSWKIRQQTGHASDAMLARYVRDGDLFTGNAAALF